VILKNHGTVSFGKNLEEAYWKTEILDAYCRILLLSRQLGRVDYFTQQQTNELLDLKKKLGFDDPRFHVENCDLCGNSAFRDGYKETLPQSKAFEPAPDYPGYLASSKAGSTSSAPSKNGADIEGLVKVITDQVLQALGKN
jgi:L-fuculose-phosphate aldolase